MHKYLEKKNEVNFDKIFNQMLGEYLYNMASLQNSKKAVGPLLSLSVTSWVRGVWQQAKQSKGSVQYGSHTCPAAAAAPLWRRLIMNNYALFTSKLSGTSELRMRSCKWEESVTRLQFTYICLIFKLLLCSVTLRLLCHICIFAIEVD